MEARVPPLFKNRAHEAAWASEVATLTEAAALTEADCGSGTHSG